MSDIAIEVKNLSKRYAIGIGRPHYDTFRDAVAQAFKSVIDSNGIRQSPLQVYWALKDISLEIKKGEVVGVVGKNGAGKSTLLKILSRITEPTSGDAIVYGRMSSLLEVGTGFHPELTGRENIYLNAAILGMKKAEVDRKFDEIVAFSEVGKFLDTPVKYYSSGMYVRLAFAVAAHLETEILIVDEVLAVGDIAFQKKCLGKMQSAASGGRTVLFVSHNMGAVENLCQRGIVLVDGTIGFAGSTKEVTDYYLRTVSGNGKHGPAHSVDLTGATRSGRRCRPILKHLELFTDGGLPLHGGLRIGAPLTAHISFELDEPVSNFGACLGFNNITGQRIFTAHSLFQPKQTDEVCFGKQVYVCDIPSLTLTAGDYRIKVSVNIGEQIDVDAIEDAISLTIIDSDYYGTGKSPWNGCCVIPHSWSLK